MQDDFDVPVVEHKTSHTDHCDHIHGHRIPMLLLYIVLQKFTVLQNTKNDMEFCWLCTWSCEDFVFDYRYDFLTLLQCLWIHWPL